MATSKQTAAARKNIKKAQAAAGREKTLAHLPRATREDLGRQGAKARARHGAAGHALEDRNRSQLYELAKERKIPGRSRMGKWDLIEALRAR
ncbi:MAG TPA: Rho termination factor N-terminal domain-containing protein [Gaiellaceae bacterium]|nr:Rho termination factor N-terminal domain-containing protein [Gaiellaceae bacterium]